MKRGEMESLTIRNVRPEDAAIIASWLRSEHVSSITKDQWQTIG